MTEGELFAGHFPRECGEHRTVGPHRAWCHDCSEWCYPDGEMACKGCRIPVLEARAALPVAAEPPQPEPGRWSFTRDELVRVLSRMEMWSVAATLSAGVPRAAGQMADAIIAALEDGE
jgi:hypothetical protein